MLYTTILHFTGLCPKSATVPLVATGSDVQPVTSPTQTTSSPASGATCPNYMALGVSVPSCAEEMLQNMPVQRLKYGNPTTGLPSSRLVTHPRELNITFKPQCTDINLANLTTNYRKKLILSEILYLPHYNMIHLHHLLCL